MVSMYIRLENLGKELMSWLIEDKEEGYYLDLRLYFNGKAYEYEEKKEEWISRDDLIGSDYVDFYDDTTLAMTFEGGLHYIMNFGYGSDSCDKFLSIFEKHGFYAELMTSWSIIAVDESTE